MSERASEQKSVCVCVCVCVCLSARLCESASACFVYTCEYPTPHCTYLEGVLVLELALTDGAAERLPPRAVLHVLVVILADLQHKHRPQSVTHEPSAAHNCPE